MTENGTYCDKHVSSWKCFFCSVIEDVGATASIHEHLSELISTNLGCHHQGQVTRIINPGRVIFPTPPNMLLRPSQITWNRRFNSIHNSLTKFLVPFA